MNKAMEMKIQEEVNSYLNETQLQEDEKQWIIGYILSLGEKLKAEAVLLGVVLGIIGMVGLNYTLMKDYGTIVFWLVTIVCVALIRLIYKAFSKRFF